MEQQQEGAAGAEVAACGQRLHGPLDANNCTSFTLGMNHRELTEPVLGAGLNGESIQTDQAAVEHGVQVDAHGPCPLGIA